MRVALPLAVVLVLSHAPPSLANPEELHELPPRPAAARALAPAAVEPSRPTAPRVEIVKRRRWGLFGGGLFLFAASYGANVGVHYGLGLTGASRSAIPVAGPWLQIASGERYTTAMTAGVPPDVAAASGANDVARVIDGLATAALTVDGMLQALGVLLVLIGPSTSTYTGRVVGGSAPREGSAVARVEFALPAGVAVSF